jgi:chromosome segregation ATPase
MTIDERIEFLMQSIESHDRQIGELTGSASKAESRLDTLTARIDTLTTRIDTLTINVDSFREITQLNFDRLTKAMMGLTEHIVDHGRRITSLEGGRA